jgi:hypothetical protein
LFKRAGRLLRKEVSKMGFTTEELMELQNEVEAEGGFPPADESSEGSDVVKVIPDGSEKDETKDKVDEKKAEDKVVKPVEGDVKKPLEKEGEVDETYELRESNRKLQAKLERVSSEYERLNKVLKDKGLVDEEDEKGRKDQEDAARASYNARMEKLSEIVEVMAVNPKYEDVTEVCSQKNFDDMFSAMARFYVSKQGGDFDETLTQVEKQVWSLPNPYKYMYDMVKKYHPSYVKDEGVKDSKKDDKVEGKGEKKEPAPAAPSLQDLPGGDGKGESGGWTDERITNLDEDELFEFKKEHPKIYASYLRGELK